MIFRRSAAVVLALSAFSGCATVEEPVKNVVPAAQPATEEQPSSPIARVAPPARPAPVIDPPPAPKVNEVEVLLADFERLRRLPAAEVAREQEAARQAFNQARSDAARVRLAMALSLPGSAGAEDVRSLELLEPLARNPVADLHGLAFLMAAYIQEQRRLASQLQGSQQNVQGLQQNVQALQQKLDALRTLERSLTEREPPRRR